MDPGRQIAVAEQIAQGTLVEIHASVLKAGERAPQVPGDTRQVPLEMRVKGCLVTAAVPGEVVEIITPAGRRLRGTLASVNPPYNHGFGAPLPELSAIGNELRSILRKRGHVR
jgi:hypothetical protein